MKRSTPKRPAAAEDAEEVDTATPAILADFDPTGVNRDSEHWAARRRGLRNLARWLRTHRRRPDGLHGVDATSWNRQRRDCVMHLGRARSAIAARDLGRAEAEAREANRACRGLQVILLATAEHERSRRARDQARDAASNPRPGARDPLRAAVVALMQREKATGVTFKKFLEQWERGPRSGLSIEWKDPEHASFVVKDEDGGMRPRDYTFRTLNKMWAEVPDYR